MSIVAGLVARYRREMYTPGWFGLLINPYYIARKRLHDAVRAHRHHMTGRMLDFGCGRKPYRDLFDVSEYVGLDVEQSGHDHDGEVIDVFYDGKTIPFPDGHFDSAFSSQVFEHVFNLPDMLRELQRVLKPGAPLLLTVPFVWDEHEVPFDFGRYTSFGIAYLLEQAGFEVLGTRKSTGTVETLTQLWTAFLSQSLLPQSRSLRVLLTPLLVAPFTLMGLAAGLILPRGEGLFLDNVVVARRRAST